jgi:hypothetical protein
MTVIEILKRSDYHYRPTLEEWDEIWAIVQASEELTRNEFIRSLYQQWERKCEGKWADRFPLLSQRQMKCLITTLYPVKPPKLELLE